MEKVPNFLIILGFTLKQSIIVVHKTANGRSIDFKNSKIPENIDKRINKLIEYLGQSSVSENVIIFSGRGKFQPLNFKEDDPFLSEAEVFKEMFDWKIQNLDFQKEGQSKLILAKTKLLILEEKSLNTIENALFSFEKIEEFMKKYAYGEFNLNISILTNKFHSRRAFMLFNYAKSFFEKKAHLRFNLNVIEAKNPSNMESDYRETIDDEYIFKQLQSHSNELIVNTYDDNLQAKDDVQGLFEKMQYTNTRLKDIFKNKVGWK